MNNCFQTSTPIGPTGIPTVFLPGWGFDGRILRLMHPAPAWIHPQGIIDPDTLETDLLHFLDMHNIKKTRIIGWSMGGMLGLDFAARHPDRVDSLLCVSLRGQWPGEEIAALKTEFAENPGAFLRSFYRKCFLGEKDLYRDFCRILEPHYLDPAVVNVAVLQCGLDFLGRFTMPALPPDIPVRLIHGTQDIIAPVGEKPALKGAAVEIVDNSGHMVFLDEGCSLQIDLKKKTIREKFSRAAASYDSYAVVQADVAGRLAARITSSVDIAGVRTILELGCGTGNFTAHLAALFPGARITALDFSTEMLARASHKLNTSKIDFICAEGETFLEQSPDTSFDLVTSNGSLQWFADHENSLMNISRILKPRGVFHGSIFGPESLKKLALGLKTLFGYPGNIAAGKFPDISRLQSILEAHFSQGSSVQELIEKEYSSVRDLLIHIKKTGTGGWHKHGAPPLTVSRINQLDDWFVRTYGGCRVAYQVHFLEAAK